MPLTPISCLNVAKPLVLHGGTGISATSLREAIALGVTKVNYGTYLKQRYLRAVRTSLAANVDNPHELWGISRDCDVMIAGRSLLPKERRTHPMHVGRNSHVDVTPRPGPILLKGFLFVTFVIFCEMIPLRSSGSKTGKQLKTF